MKTIALNILATHGEAALLDRALQSVWPLAFDEVIIGIPHDEPDGGPVHSVAERWASKIVRHEWHDSFADARNAVLNVTTSDYIFFMDADDILKPEHIGAFCAAARIVRDNEYDYYSFLYEVGFDDKGAATDTIRRVEFFVNRPQVRWSGDVHEHLTSLETSSNFGSFDGIALTHKPADTDKCSLERNIRILEKMYADPAKRNARTRFYLAKEYWVAKRYEDAIGMFAELVDRQEGSADQIAIACYSIALFYTYDMTRGDEMVTVETASIGETYCRVGLSFSTAYAELYVLLADIMAIRGNKDAAIGLYKRAMQCKHGVAALPQKSIYYKYIPADRIATIYFQRGMYVESLYYNHIADTVARDGRTLRNRRMILAELTDETERLGNGK